MPGAGAFPFWLAPLLRPVCGSLASTMQESPDFQRQQANGTVPKFPCATLSPIIARASSDPSPSRRWDRLPIMSESPILPAFLTSTGTAGRRSIASTINRGGRCRYPGDAVDGRLVGPVGPQTRAAVSYRMQRHSSDSDVPCDAQGSSPASFLGAIILACVAGAVSAVGAVATAEQFPGEGRSAAWLWAQPGWRPPFSVAPRLSRPAFDRSNRFAADSWGHDRRRGAVRPSYSAPRFRDDLKCGARIRREWWCSQSCPNQSFKNPLKYREKPPK